MAFKQFALDERTTITIYKRRASRSLRLSIAPNGEVRVSIPAWAPYSAGLQFARSRHDWITKQAQNHITNLLAAGQAVGKAHHLHFIASPQAKKTTSRVLTTEITVTHPTTLTVNDPTVQKVADAACIRALRGQAEQLLPQRLAQLARIHDLDYKSISIKRLKSRWGSCDQQRNIVLNLFLMQLPWECIDYVLIHELVHTKVMRHGPDFWQAMAEELPAVAQLRKQMRAYQPVLHGSPATAVA